MHLDLAALEPIHVGPTNCFVIDTGEGLLLIDTGINADHFWHTLVDGLDQRGHQPQDVRWVLLTHAHNDHCGLASRMKHASGAEVLVHREEIYEQIKHEQSLVSRTSFATPAKSVIQLRKRLSLNSGHYLNNKDRDDS